MSHPLDLDSDKFSSAIARRTANRATLAGWIKDNLKEGTDFGVIPLKRGNPKPTLWRSGAEKIASILGLIAKFPNAGELSSAAAGGVDIKKIIIQCDLCGENGAAVATGIGSRSLSQDSGDLNKAVKMALKSAMIDAVLRLDGISEFFTQDLEDMPQIQSNEYLIKQAAKNAGLPDEKWADFSSRFVEYIKKSGIDDYKAIQDYELPTLIGKIPSMVKKVLEN